MTVDPEKKFCELPGRGVLDSRDVIVTELKAVNRGYKFKLNFDCLELRTTFSLHVDSYIRTTFYENIQDNVSIVLIKRIFILIYNIVYIIYIIYIYINI